MAFGVLADVATGAPRLLSRADAGHRHPHRRDVGAGRAPAGAPGQPRMALIGNGAQSEFQALAFRDLVGIRELRLFDTDTAASAKLAANLAGQGLDGAHLRAAPPRPCAAPTSSPPSPPTRTTRRSSRRDMIEPGMHVNAVGGDCPGKTELHRGVLEAATVFVEYEPQTRIEGDIQQMPADFAVTEFWHVLAGATPGRTDAGK